MRLGLFGGTFDPVHYGHLLLAECCREQAALDEVWFVPAAASPFKQGAVQTSAQQRLEMLALAIGGHAQFRVSSLEIDRGGVSYTVDTLEELHRARPDDELFLLLGADALEDFPTWRQPQRICHLATLLVVRRPGWAEPDLARLAAIASPSQLDAIRRGLVEMPQIDLSSRDLRRRVAAGQSIRYRTPRAVETFIASAGLYRQ